MKRWLFLLLLCPSAWAQRSVETNQSIPSLGPVGAPENSNSVRVESGVGARTLDPKENELGVELKSMENIEELSTQRREKPWWLKPKVRSGLWSQQLHADFSGDQDFRLRTMGRRGSVETRLDVGVTQDHRSFDLLKSNNNPYLKSDETQVSVAGRKDSSYGSLWIRGEQFQALADFDSKVENIFAGDLLSGQKASREQSLSMSIDLHALELIPFARGQIVDFSSNLSPIYSNTTTASQVGLKSKVYGAKWKFEPQVSSETWERKFTDVEGNPFRRYDFLMKGFYEDQTLAQISWRSHLFFEQAQVVHLDSRPLQIWDMGLELSSDREKVWGWSGQARRFAKMPTPTQLFGDGVLLQGTSDLPAATGLRFATGPWWKIGDWEWQVAGFSERGENEPATIAVSPSQARTIPIGGVWSRGLAITAELKTLNWKWTTKYSYQDAVNASEINWQRGQRVPGRPQHDLGTGLEHENAHWKQGISYRYQSEDALDLAGLWWRPPQHDLGAYFGYGQRTWEVRLAARHLLASMNQLPRAEFAGSAGPSLLEPAMEQTEVRFQCEILL